MVMPLHFLLVAGTLPRSTSLACWNPTREPMDSFGSRLRYERERRQIALKSIAESTKISISLLEGLERDDVSRWPSGIFRKSFIRSYAEAIGLKPDVIAREFVERYPDPHDVQLAAVPPGSRPSQAKDGEIQAAHPVSKPPSPLAIKIKITWSDSVQRSLVRLADGKFGRLVRWLLATPRESGDAAPDPARPA